MKFYGNPSIGSRVVPCGQSDRKMDGRADGRVDVTKLIVAFRNFANAPKSVCFLIKGQNIRTDGRTDRRMKGHYLNLRFYFLYFIKKD